MVQQKSLIATGSVALDTLETPHGTTEEVLGGSASHFSLTVSHFHPVQLVGVVGDDFPEEHIELLKNHGVDLTYLKTLEGPTFRWHGKYTGPMEEAETLEVQLNVHEQFEPPFEEPGPTPDVLFLGNISPRFQQDTLDAMGERPDLVAADTMHLWIETDRPALEAFLQDVDLFFLNYEEALKLADEANTVRAGKKLQDLGPETVVIKKGEHGSIAFHGEETIAVPGYPLSQERDPTGAGDTFAGGVLSAICRSSEYSTDALQAGLILGTLLASFNVETVGTGGMRYLDLEELQERYQSYRNITGLSAGAGDFLSELLE